MEFDRRRGRVTDQLVDGFFAFGGDTVTRAGDSLRGTPGFAVSLPWVSSTTTLPHRRYVAEWYDQIGSEPFLSKNRGKSLIEHLAHADRAPLCRPRLATFPEFPAAYGVWRDTDGDMALAVSVVVPELSAAVWWGHAFSQEAIYDLLNKRVIWLNRRDGEGPPAACPVSPSHPSGGHSCTRTCIPENPAATVFSRGR